MEFLPEKINAYTEAHTSPEPELLQRLSRETQAKVLRPRMLSGHLQGRLLSAISHMMRPRRVLEIGTYTGYSALCLAEGLAEDGQLHTIDINEELEDMVRRYFAESSYTHKLHQHIGNALEVIPELLESWDLVFIDADKENYARYYDLVLNNVRSGGFVIADNVLWSGKVVEKASARDKETQALLEFNEMVHQDERVENLLLPVRDGLMLCRKL